MLAIKNLVSSVGGGNLKVKNLIEILKVYDGELDMKTISVNIDLESEKLIEEKYSISEDSIYQDGNELILDLR